jgi:type IV pilus assembly protein PilE
MLRFQRGFSLIELMVVVMIVLLLAAVAIPSYLKYLRNAQTSEARIQVEKMALGARAYFADPPSRRNSAEIVARQFPRTVAVTPAVTCCASAGRRCAPIAALWTDPTWIALGFSMDDPHNFRYQFVSSGVATTSVFTARALGDLDCDGTQSTFEMYGAIGKGGEPTSGGGLVRIQHLE